MAIRLTGEIDISLLRSMVARPHDRLTACRSTFVYLYTETRIRDDYRRFLLDGWQCGHQHIVCRSPYSDMDGKSHGHRVQTYRIKAYTSQKSRQWPHIGSLELQNLYVST
jgi:hypothetical protein